MKNFPNLVFEQGSFDCLYFFNPLVLMFPPAFYLDLVKETFGNNSNITVEVPIPDTNYESYLLGNLPHPSHITTYEDMEALKPWLESSNWSPYYCQLWNNFNSIQIYSDPHDWDICVIGVKYKDEPMVTKWLKDAGYYEKRMTDLNEFYEAWQEFATPKLFDYAMKNLKEHYLPFII